MAQRRLQKVDSHSWITELAQNPSILAAAFLFTALFPWLLYFLVPALSSVKGDTLLTLVQWLSPPVLFLIVNCAIFFMWMNAARSHAANSDNTSNTDFLDFQEQKPSDYVSRFQEHVERKKAKSSSESSSDEEVNANSAQFRRKKPDKAYFAPVEVSPLNLQEAYEAIKPILDIPKEEPHVRGDSPRTQSKFAPYGPSEFGEKRKLVAELKSGLPLANGKKQHKSGVPTKPIHHSNTSPRPTASALDDLSSQLGIKKEERSHSFNTADKPKHVRRKSNDSTISIEKPKFLTDDPEALNDRIESFLTNFKMRRQESYLRAIHGDDLTPQY